MGITAMPLAVHDEVDITSGHCQFLFGSSESWLLNKKWRDMLGSDVFQANVIGYIDNKLVEGMDRSFELSMKALEWPSPSLPPCLRDGSGRWRLFKSAEYPYLLVEAPRGTIDEGYAEEMTLITLLPPPQAPSISLNAKEPRGTEGA
ncbi:unnamed protein product [Pleuronectes platessa]|uniref:Uncharacterized protein n=1 Tax=Pleuronectes platessa TaxID=8262 RepID=A0A9N7UAX5_PLEPL|nr:unnamed protein product [Pleuronectes platessa]